MGFLGAPLGYIMYWIMQVINNYGWALIIFTVLVKLVLFPLSIKQQKNTAKMTGFQPKIKEIQRKYKDKQKQQEEMMKLYEQEGYNPMSGCLPMLAQFIVLFGIIDVVYKPLNYIIRIPGEIIAQLDTVLKELAINVSSSSQLAVIKIIQDGSQANADAYSKLVGILSPDQLSNIQNLNMNFLGLNLGDTPSFAFNALLIIPILAGVTAFITSIISTKQQEKMGQTMNKGMKMTFYLMPLMSVYFGFTLPAGVGIYWSISNITMIAQQLILAKIYTPERMAKMSGNVSEKSKAKMAKKRERIEQLRKIQADKLASVPKSEYDDDEVIEDNEKSKIKTPEELLEEKAKEMSTADRIKEARKKLAEKYGEEYTD